MRDASGNIPAKGEQGFVPATERPYAQQKAGLLPEEFNKRVDVGDLLKNNADSDEVLANIKRAYGAHNDPKMESAASFITPDAKHIDLPSGVDHTDAIEEHGGEKTSGPVDNRAKFINETGTIRVHKARERAGNVLAFSVPKDGVTPAQAAEMEKSVSANADPNGLLRIERADVNADNYKDAHVDKEQPKPEDVKGILDRIYGKKSAPVGAGARAALDQQIAAAENGAKQAEPADKYYTPGGRLKINDLMKNNAESDAEQKIKASGVITHSLDGNDLPTMIFKNGGMVGEQTGPSHADLADTAYGKGKGDVQQLLKDTGAVRISYGDAEKFGTGDNDDLIMGVETHGVPTSEQMPHIAKAFKKSGSSVMMWDMAGKYGEARSIGEFQRAANSLRTGDSKNNAEGDHISTRVPEGKDATEDPLGQPLHIDREALSRAPEKLQDKFAQKAREVAGVKIPKNITDNEKIYDRFQRHVADNLKYVYNKATPEEKVANAKWYESANKRLGR